MEGEPFARWPARQFKVKGALFKKGEEKEKFKLHVSHHLQLKLAGHNIGPNTLQKVMAGDKITASVQYYYENATGGNNPDFVSNILSSLSQAITGGTAATSMVHNNAANISTQLNGNTGFINALQPTGSGGSTPQAYLTILFFDERFNFISAEDGGVAQQQVASTYDINGPPLGLANIKAPKNGYAYVYVSNRSDQHVYFDNLQVSNVSGNIIEENHYYVFGLKITGISSKKLGDANEGKLKNPYQYNGKEMLDEDADLNWLDYGFRNYDPQIGRFPQIDPLTDDNPFMTPYQYALNDPITNIDVEGLNGCPSVAGLSGYVGNVSHALSSGTSAFVSTASIIVSVLGTTSTVMITAGSIVNSKATENTVRAQSAGNSINGKDITTQAGGSSDPGSMTTNSGNSSTHGGPNMDNDNDAENYQAPPKVVPYLVFENATPETYQHIKDVTSREGPWGKRKDLLLRYDGDAERKKNRGIKNLTNSGLMQMTDPWRDEYPFKCTYQGDDADVRHVPAWEQRLQAAELRTITSTLKDGDYINVILIPKFSPPPIVQPKWNPGNVKKWQTPNWIKDVDLRPALYTGAAAGGLLYLLETYGIFVIIIL